MNRLFCYFYRKNHKDVEDQQEQQDPNGLIDKELDGETHIAPWNAGLTDRQIRFVLSYIESDNATQATIDAGFTQNRVSAATMGFRLLRNVQISEALAKLYKARAMSVEETLSRLTSIARGSIAPFVDDSSSGRSLRLDLNTEEARKYYFLIKKVSDEGQAIELLDPLAAMRLLMQLQGKLIEKKEVSGSNGEPIKTETTHVIAPETIENFFAVWKKKYE